MGARNQGCSADEHSLCVSQHSLFQYFMSFLKALVSFPDRYVPAGWEDACSAIPCGSVKD